ncbi:unnamed protein product [Lampetra fluviatilis]
MSNEVPASAGTKRSKAQYMGGAAKRARTEGGGGGGGSGPRQLEAGMEGVLLTCNMQERRCTTEGYQMLNEQADRLYGPEKFDDDEEEVGGGGAADGADKRNDDDDGDDDAEAALQKEVAQIKKRGAATQRRFRAVTSGANNLVFIRSVGVEPDTLVHGILSELAERRQSKSRHVLRVLPVTASCRAYPADVERAAEAHLPRWFAAPHRATFQVVYKARNNGNMHREETIKAVAGVVLKLNAENQVDLTEPELTVVVEVIRAVCCLSVVRDYVRLRKYNLQEVAKLGPCVEVKQRPQKATQATADAAEGDPPAAGKKEAAEGEDKCEKDAGKGKDAVLGESVGKGGGDDEGAAAGGTSEAASSGEAPRGEGSTEPAASDSDAKQGKNGDQAAPPCEQDESRGDEKAPGKEDEVPVGGIE